jgi:hypothetical protein
MSEGELRSRAWEIRKAVINQTRNIRSKRFDQQIWDATAKDLANGSAIGPFHSEEEVSRFFGSDEWIPTPRNGVEQKSKVRGVDNSSFGKPFSINDAQSVTELLDVGSTDKNVAILKKIKAEAKTAGKEVKIESWVLDEKDAYRQIPIRPDHRKFSVIVVRNPQTGALIFVIMIGHSFGLVSAVYNYNRRSAIIQEILTKLFFVVSGFFYDDKYGFEPQETFGSALTAAVAVHLWLGCDFEVSKIQMGNLVKILGVEYDLRDKGLLKIAQERKDDLVSEINKIIQDDKLTPGHAGKLKGKLFFAASQLWGKIGRAFMLALSERQYSRSFEEAITKPIGCALQQWLKLARDGRPRPIEYFENDEVDAVLFTDGFSPDGESVDQGEDAVGAVLFHKELEAPVAFHMVIPSELRDQWIPRESQITMIETFAPIVALQAFGEELRNTKLLLMVDSEAAEGALVKGYSSRSDLTELTSVFWDMCSELNILVYIDRVSTDANPADPPSRGERAKVAGLGWSWIQACVPERLRCF